MPTNENQQQDEAGEDKVSAAESVGVILRAERLRQDLTEKKVADQLHITMHYVRAIESNSFEKLPGAVFAKGYIKSYALLLGLEQSQIIGSYDEYVNDQQDAAREKTRIQVRRRKDKNRPWVIGSGIAFVGLFVVLWLFNSGSDESNEPVSDVPSQPQNLSQLEPRLADDVVVTPAAILIPLEPMAAEPPAQDGEGQIQSTDSAGSANAGSMDSTGDSTVDDGTDTEVGIIEAVVSEINEVAVQAQPTFEQNDQRQLSQSTEKSSASDAVPSPQKEPVSDQSTAAIETRNVPEPDISDGRILVEAEGSDVLLITFIGESWVEVSDGFENLIYRDLRDAGNVLEIIGTAPFNVLLGDAPYVKMTLNGTVVDASRNIRIDNSVRLKVGL
jgi:cytoskeleton protein RodZ